MPCHRFAVRHLVAAVNTTVDIVCNVDSEQFARAVDAITWLHINERHRRLHGNGNTVDALLDMHARFDTRSEMILPERSPERRTP